MPKQGVETMVNDVGLIVLTLSLPMRVMSMIVTVLVRVDLAESSLLGIVR